MIFAALAIAFAQAPNASNAFKATLQRYRACVQKNALDFEPARESVVDTVAAAFAACGDERAAHIFAILDLQKASGQPEPSISKADENVQRLVDEGLRDELVVQLMRVRSAR